jgi:hypothetical protein
LTLKISFASIGAMRFRPGLRLISFVAVATLLWHADVGAAQAAQPHLRPALVGNGPKSLVNLIDTRKLVAKGQGDGVVMFNASVDDDGSVFWAWCHARPESGRLKTEVERALLHATFSPAVIDGKSVGVGFYGTVVFAVRNGHPYLRVFANQASDELARESDFIEPQMLLDSGDWEKARPYLEVVRHHARAGFAVLSISVDAEGHLGGLKLVREEPKGLNIGAAAMKGYSTAKFIPAFRDGKPVACTFERDWNVRGYTFRRW